MSEWKKVKIGEIFAIEKGSLQSSKNTAGNYNFITAASDWKTHNTYDHDCEAIVYAVAASGSLGRAHYVNGKFIASDLCFILTEKDKKQYPINFLFYQLIFEMMREEIVSHTKTGTSKESINRTNFSNYEIPYFSIEYQQQNYQRLVDSKNKIILIDEELEKQKEYTKQLRQNILQDAIEGKLTADWRAQHPVIKGNPDYDAEALFEKIQKIKKSLKNDLLVKREKARPSISSNEKEFDIPRGWIWSRMGELCYPITKGTTPEVHEIKAEGEIPYLKMFNIVNQKIDFDYRPQYISKKIHEEKLARSKVFPNDVIMNIVGPPMGKIAIIPDEFPEWNLNQAMAIFRGYDISINPYIYIFLNSMVWFKYVHTLGVVGQENMSLAQCKDIIVSLPPLAEQKEIVARVEAKLQSVTALENQIAEREQLIKQLMQSILKDAFEEK